MLAFVFVVIEGPLGQEIFPHLVFIQDVAVLGYLDRVLDLYP